MLKVDPHPEYPQEDGRYLRGNDSSPVAVAIILNCDADKIPPELEILVRAGIETGAALSGTVQTENIGFEKIVCNIVAEEVIRLSENFPAMLTKGGRCIVSGFVTASIPRVEDALNRHGLRTIETPSEEGWAACVAMRPERGR